jgi:hypothetical protein
MNQKQVDEYEARFRGATDALEASEIAAREVERLRAMVARLEAALVKAGEAAIQTGAVKVAHIIADALEGGE